MIFPNNLAAARDEPSLGKKQSAFQLLCPFCSVPLPYTFLKEPEVRRKKIEVSTEEITCTLKIILAFYSMRMVTLQMGTQRNQRDLITSLPLSSTPLMVSGTPETLSW